MGPIKQSYEAITAFHYRMACIYYPGNGVPPWESLPEWLRYEMIDIVQMIIERPDVTPKEIHEIWVKRKEKEGWKFGEKFDEEKKESDILLPYNQLSERAVRAGEEFIGSIKLIYGFTGELSGMIRRTRSFRGPMAQA